MVEIEKIFEYLEKKIPNFKKINRKGKVLFSCPQSEVHKFNKDPSVTIMPGSEKFYCLSCGWKGSLYDLVRIVEKNPTMIDKEIVSLITNEMKADLYPELDHYQRMGWYLLPLYKNGRAPIKDFEWRKMSTNDKSKWISWLEAGYGLAADCGKSNLTVIDVDLKVAPTGTLEEIYKLLTASKTLMQSSPHGRHFFYNLDKDIPQNQNDAKKKGTTTIDTRTEGGYIIAAPTKIDNLSYRFINLGSDIKNVPEKIKAKVLELLKVDKVDSEKKAQEMSPEMKKIIDNPIELVANNLIGCCNDTFVQFGGALLKMGLPMDKVRGVLYYLNKHWLKNPMPSNTIDAMLGSLDGYKQTEEHTQEQAIYDACKLIQVDISAKDILDHVFSGEKTKRAIVDKYLTKFYKEGKLSRLRRGRYDLKEKVEWTDEKKETFPVYSYKMPYFEDKAYFHSGDIIIIGGKTGEGKTHIAINIIKQMKEQGIKPYYISLEAGSRYEKVAEALGMTVKDFYVSKEPIDNPLSIELESNAFTIIDWLYTGEDFAATQAIFKHLNDEMVRKGGILIVFTQLKEDGTYFAVNLIKSFARFSCRFRYDDNQGIVSHFDIDKMTDPKGHNLTDRVETLFDFETKELKIKEIL